MAQHEAEMQALRALLQAGLAASADREAAQRIGAELTKIDFPSGDAANQQRPT